MTTLRQAMIELLDEIDNLESVTVTRNIARYKAEACWEFVVDQARESLRPKPWNPIKFIIGGSGCVMGAGLIITAVTMDPIRLLQTDLATGGTALLLLVIVWLFWDRK